MAVHPRGLPRLQDLPSNTFFLDDSNTSLIKYTAPFKTSQNNTCTGGTCTRLGSASGSLEFSFTGTDAWLFGKPGGLTRIFLDNELVQVLDTSTLPNNGSALWAATGLSQGVHTIKLGGLDGNDGLNLLVDFFSVSGVVSAISTTDANYLSPGQLTPIIIGSLLGFFVLVAVIVIAVLLCVRRKKRRRAGKSGVKLMSFDGAAASRRSTSRIGLLSGFSGLFPGRRGTDKRPQIDMASDGYGGRVSNSTDGGNPFLKSQYASMNSNTVASAYSPPTSADPSIPLFAQPVSQSRARQLSFIPESSASSYSSMPSPPLQRPQPPLEQQRQQQLQHLRQLQLVNPASVYPPKSDPLNNEPEPEKTPLMEAPPPGYHQDPTFQYRPPETVKPSDCKVTNLPARGAGDSKVAMASFSTVQTPTTTTTTTMQNPQSYIPTPQTYPFAPPSFTTLEAHSRTHGGPVPPLPMKMDNSSSKDPQLSTGKTLKGPRPRGGSNAQPMWASVAEEMQRPEVRSPAVTSPGSMRPEDEDPESPVDPAVNYTSHWY